VAFTHSFEDIARRPVAVIGAGTLGRRIAVMFASRGGTVCLYSRSKQTVAEAIDYARLTLPEVVAARSEGSVGEVVPVTDIGEALDNAWLAVETIPEKLEVKRSIWAKIDAAAPSDTIFATNSSSYPSRLMSDVIADKSRLCNLHFYMPPVANAADIMSNGHTDPALIQTLLTVLPAFGIQPFEARRESVGFIFNRVWAAIKRESLAVVAEGVAEPADLDAMFRLNLGASAGPFQLMDAVGLDVVLDIEEHYATTNPNLPTAPRQLLHTYIDEGKLGVKSGLGFYSYGGSQ